MSTHTCSNPALVPRAGLRQGRKDAVQRGMETGKEGPSPGPRASPEVNMEIHPEEPGTNSSGRCLAPIPIQKDGLLTRALWSVTKGKGVAASISKSSG